MTIMSRIMSVYPAVLITSIMAVVVWFGFSPSFWQPIIFIFILYFVPVLSFRIHNFIFPIKSGFTRISDPKYNPWWGAHQIQLIYIALPSLEALLRMIPGFYSFWLRLWGSKVGKSVYWTPLVRIEDRNLVEIGNSVVFGHKVECYSHIVSPKNETLYLFTKKITIGDDVFIGAGVRMGPGTTVPPKTLVPLLTDLSSMLDKV